MYTISIIGLGYIGLPTAIHFAKKGNKVYGYDTKREIIDNLNSGMCHIEEPGLQETLTDCLKNKDLQFIEVPHPADLYIICVPTPSTITDDGVIADLSFVRSAVRSISHIVQPGSTVILESTSPIGTSQRVANFFSEFGVDSDSLLIAYCPERVLPGRIFDELENNDRVVGGLTDEATEFVREFYQANISGYVYATGAETAEMCKLVENSYRDLNIAFANSLANIANKFDIDVWELIRLANRHPRVEILNPGIGVGGHCLAVDPWFLVSNDPANARLIRYAREENERRPNIVADIILNDVRILERQLQRAPKLAIFGMSYKPNINDFRESPALNIINTLQSQNVDLVVVEPHASARLFGLNFVSTNQAFNEVDLCYVLVPHDEFLTEEIINHKKMANAFRFVMGAPIAL